MSTGTGTQITGTTFVSPNGVLNGCFGNIDINTAETDRIAIGNYITTGGDVKNGVSINTGGSVNLVSDKRISLADNFGISNITLSTSDGVTGINIHSERGVYINGTNVTINSSGNNIGGYTSITGETSISTNKSIKIMADGDNASITIKSTGTSYSTAGIIVTAKSGVEIKELGLDTNFKYSPYTSSTGEELKNLPSILDDIQKRLDGLGFKEGVRNWVTTVPSGVSAAFSNVSCSLDKEGNRAIIKNLYFDFTSNGSSKDSVIEFNFDLDFRPVESISIIAAVDLEYIKSGTVPPIIKISQYRKDVFEKKSSLIIRVPGQIKESNGFTYNITKYTYQIINIGYETA